MKAAVGRVLCGVLCLIFGAPALAFDLQAAYRLALENDAGLKAERAVEQAARLELPLARRAFFPDLRIGGSYGERRNDQGRTNPIEERRADLNWTLFQPAEWIAIDQAELSVERARLRYENARETLALRLAQGYFEVLAALDQQQVAILNEQALERQLRLADERLAVGLGTRTEQIEARARMLQAQSERIAVEVELNNTVQLLEQIISDPQSTASVGLEDLARLRPNAPLEMPGPATLNDWLALGKNNPALQAERLSERIAQLEWKRVGRAYPSLSLNLNARDSFDTADKTDYSASLTASYPLYGRGQFGLSRRRAQMLAIAAEERAEALHREIEATITAEFLSIGLVISQVQALEQAVLASEASLQAREEGFEVGIYTHLDVLDTQRDLSRVRSDYSTARYRYILARMRLTRAAGQLDDDFIAHINTWLIDPKFGAGSG